jgi:K+-sensing histidine kinase KdpD
MEAIGRFNQERRINWKETASNDVRIPEAGYFATYETLRDTETDLVKSEEKESIKSIEENVENIKTGTIYADPSLDIL